MASTGRPTLQAQISALSKLTSDAIQSQHTDVKRLLEDPDTSDKLAAQLAQVFALTTLTMELRALRLTIEACFGPLVDTRNNKDN